MKASIRTDNGGSVGITTMIILIATILVGVIAASTMIAETTGTSPEDDLTELADQTVDDAIEEVTTYIDIPERYGKFYGQPGQKQIEKIALGIRSLISKTIDLSNLTVQLNDGEMIKTLFYSGYSEKTGSNSVFEHPIWDNISTEDFGFIVTRDIDYSIVDYDAITESSDRAYLIIKLPDDMKMSKGETIIVNLIPPNGIIRTIELKAPMPMKSVIIFD